MATCVANDVIQNASTSGFTKLSERDQLSVIAQRLYDITSSTDDVDTLMSAAKTAGFTKVTSSRYRLAILLQLLVSYNAAGDNAGQILANSSLSGFLFMSTKQKRDALLQLLCDSSANTAEVTSWLSAVAANGGAAPSASTVTALNAFVTALETASIKDKMIIVNPIVPDSDIAARTPLIKGPGHALWIDSGVDSPTIGVNGAECAGKTCRWEVGAGPQELGWNPGMQDAGVIAYHYANGTGTGYVTGCNTGGVSGKIQLYNKTILNRFQAVWGNLSFGYINWLASPTSFFGYVGTFNVTGANGMKMYVASSTKAHTLAAQDTASGIVDNTTIDFYALCNNDNDNVTVQQPFKGTVSFLAYTKNLTESESSDLYDAIQALRTGLGGGAI
jgi:hypothetical protein